VPSRWFRISFAPRAFERFVRERGLEPHELSLEQAVTAMADFYSTMRAQHTVIDAGGDGLLFRWGESDVGLRVDVVRQLTRSGPDEPARRLALSFEFESAALEAGSLWFANPTADVATSIRDSEAYRVASALAASRVTLAFE
jgi:hypothetical protein